MVLDSDIRDQAYQFFIQEAPELLHVIETELLTLRSERSTTKIHSLMRAAHSIKGGAACIGLEVIKTLAHRLEDAFKALHNEELEIDAELDNLLLQAYDCLRLPLMEEINTGYLDAEQAVLSAEPVFAEIEEKLGDFIHGEEFLPSSVELGIDIALSIFEIDVPQGLERLEQVLADPEHNLVAGELRAQAEVFTGIAELLSLPGFEAIAKTTLAALNAHPEQAIQIAQLALVDFQAGQQAVIAGDRNQGGSPSAALLQLADPTFQADNFTYTAINLVPEVTDIEVVPEQKVANLEPSIDDVFGTFTATESLAEVVEPNLGETNPNFLVKTDLEPELFIDSETIDINASLDDVFGTFTTSESLTERVEPNLIETIPSVSLEENIEPELVSDSETININLSIDDVFGSFTATESLTEIVEPSSENNPSLPEAENLEPLVGDSETTDIHSSIDDVFGSFTISESLSEIVELSSENNSSVSEAKNLEPLVGDSETTDIHSSIDDVFGSFTTSESLLEIVETSSENNPSLSEADNLEPSVGDSETTDIHPSIDDVFGSFTASESLLKIVEPFPENNPSIPEAENLEPLVGDSETTDIHPSIDDVFGSFTANESLLEIVEPFPESNPSIPEADNLEPLVGDSETTDIHPSIDDVFGSFTASESLSEIVEPFPENNPSVSEAENLEPELVTDIPEILDSDTTKFSLINALQKVDESATLTGEETVAITPSTETQSSDYLALDIDITLSLFEADVAEGINRLSTILLNPEDNIVLKELKEQAELFISVAEIINLPGFAAIAQTTLTAINAHPERIIQIAQLAVADFEAAYQLVKLGDRTKGGSPSIALIELANSVNEPIDYPQNIVAEQSLASAEISTKTTEILPVLDEVFVEAVPTASITEKSGILEADITDSLPTNLAKENIEILLSPLPENTDTPALEDIFSDFVAPESNAETLKDNILESQPINVAEVSVETPLSPLAETNTNSQIENIFGNSVAPEPITDRSEVAEGSLDKLNIETQPETSVETTDTTPSLEDIFGGFVVPQPTTELSELLKTNTAKLSLVKPNESQPETLDKTTTPIPSLEDIFGGFVAPQLSTDNSKEITSKEIEVVTPPKLEQTNVNALKNQSKFQNIVQSVEKVFNTLPQVEEIPNSQPTTENSTQVKPPAPTKSTATASNLNQKPTAKNNKPTTSSTQNLTVRVDLDRLERMNNLVGELAINRNGLSLQNEQLQTTVQELLRRFTRFQEMASNLRDLSDHMVVAPERRAVLQNLPIFAIQKPQENLNSSLVVNASTPLQPWFDSLEMDSYGELHSLLQGTLEEMAQLEEIVNDVALLAGQSTQTLESQRQKLNHLREDLMWARMLPLGELLTRFPRTLRELSNTYKKPVELKLNGTGVLVDKAVLEKLNDPLMHLLRNAFDHGIEAPEVRREQGKPEQGTIEIRAYHQGSQTVIEVRDDGKGINIERIREKAFDSGLLSVEQANTISTAQLIDFIFEPGFSTAAKVSELSGRGVGLDIVRSQLHALKGTVNVSSTLGKGTVFTLRIPLTLTIAKLLVCLMGFTGFAFPADSIEEILIPKPTQIKRTGKQKFLHWRNRVVPIYHLSELLDYAVPLPEAMPSQALVAVPTPEDWASPVLLINQGTQFLALEIDRLVTEQELVIKPFGEAIAPPSYIYGCTILGDGSLIPVIDCASLLNRVFGQSHPTLPAITVTESLPSVSTPDSTDAEISTSPPKTVNAPQISKSSLILVVDDSIALRQTVALNLQKAGYRVLQARDGREALEQLQQNSSIQLVVSDVEMPNMNGFEFLNHRRQDPQIAKIPVIMLTSRSSAKHKQLATHLGASGYLTKPYLEPEFLATIKSILDKNSSVAPVGETRN